MTHEILAEVAKEQKVQDAHNAQVNEILELMNKSKQWPVSNGGL